MDKKITIQQFAEVLAEKCNVRPDVALKFLKSMAREISAELEDTGKCRVADFGDFSVVKTDDGYNSVGFSAEAAIADKINEPFNSFFAVELDEDYSDSAIDVTNAEKLTEDATSIPSSSKNSATDVATPLEQKLSEEEPAAEIIESEEALNALDEAVSIADEEQMAEVAEAPEESSVCEISETSVSADEAEGDINREIADEIAEPSSPLIANKSTEPVAMPTIPDTPPVFDAAKAYAAPRCGYRIPEDEEEYVQPVHKDNRALYILLGVLAGIIVTFGILALGFFVFKIYFEQ